ncbi:LytTR family DNA-binding domain-containing protein [Brevundimonas sp. Root1279]|uniref:LytTR family DNA-binding domain-containing protein n=1 Tax=Brevundimonas sp. Root1279 TaxID=1736443 RepID=UPI0012E37F92|nr:LytTR family DNA-binding domain-containing protein [Brevundimonas sp. Root1279]
MWRPGGDGRARHGTSGAAPGTGGGLWAALKRADPRDLRTGLLWIVPATAVVTVVNSLSDLADLPHVQRWEPWTWEISSALAILVATVIPWLATAAAPPDEAAGEGWRPKLRFAAVHLTALLLFSALHVAGFVLIRKLTYAAMDADAYMFGNRFIYELRKDLISYCVYVGTFWLLGSLRRRRDEPVRPVSFDIRDGARIIRTSLSDILAVSSAGNYVEFWLADGRRPLMRATLAAIEVELERFGFVRAHRSWLVNAGAVTGLRPDGSGDWTVELGAVEAPVSRRYPQALERLKK